MRGQSRELHLAKSSGVGTRDAKQINSQFSKENKPWPILQ
jgi:hypothetical protein